MVSFPVLLMETSAGSKNSIYMRGAGVGYNILSLNFPLQFLLNFSLSLVGLVVS